jgi:small subunit ribosomal protein S1
MDLKNEELEKLYAETFQGIESGSILTGKIVSVKPDSVIVDVGFKSEGIIKGSEFSSEELDSLGEGDEIEVFVVSTSDSEGMIALSRERATRIKAWATLEESLKENSPVEGVLIEKTKGGAFVNISGLKAFLPASHIDLRPVRDIDSLLGKRMMFKILKVNSRRSNIIVSRRQYLEEMRESMRSDTLEKLNEGELMKGTVKNITDYGVFVDLGGVDGLLHISDISWGRISHPSAHFSVGDEIEVLVLNFDSENEKVTLGYKQKKPDPWSTVEEKYPPGTRVGGKVVSIADYGVFVEVEEALEGLVHVSEIEWASRPKHPSKYVSEGDSVEAVVLNASSVERKLSLSLKQIKPSPWELVAERYRPGQTIKGTVRGITDFGAFIGLPEGVDGLVHISDLSWTKHLKHPSEMLRKGDEVEAVVLSIEPDKERIALGIKQVTSDPWVSDIPQKYKLGDEITCIVLRLTDFGIFVELNKEVEGLIYSSEIVETDETINEGNEVMARIIKVDLDNRKIGLSMKNVTSSKE